MVFLELKLSMLTSFVLYLNGKFLKAVHHFFFILYITLVKAYSQQIFLTEWMEKDVELRTQSLSLKNGVKRECRQGECSRSMDCCSKSTISREKNIDFRIHWDSVTQMDQNRVVNLNKTRSQIQLDEKTNMIIMEDWEKIISN